jgi:hypothetical protein
MKKSVASAGALFALITISVVDGSGHQLGTPDTPDPWTAKIISDQKSYNAYQTPTVDWSKAKVVVAVPVKKSKHRQTAKLQHPPAHAAVRQVLASGVPAKSGFPGFNFDPGQMLVNQAVNLLPGPESMLGGMVYGGGMSAVANIMYSSIVVSMKEDRELGAGEAFQAALSGAIPFVGGFVAGPITDAMFKDYDDCKDPFLYMGLREDDPVPRAARVAWFLYKYCGGREPHEYDGLLAQAGIKKLARYQLKQ